MTQPNTIIESEDAYVAASRLARGSYQQALLDGYASLSGAELEGKARDYVGRYAKSRRSFLARLTKAGVPWCERQGNHGKRILVIGASA